MCGNPGIKENYTMALALPKNGFRKNNTAGKLYLDNLGSPKGGRVINWEFKLENILRIMEL